MIDRTSLTRQEVAERLNIHPKTVDRWAKQGLLHPFKIARTTRYPEHEIDKLFNKGKEMESKKMFGVVTSSAGTYEALGRTANNPDNPCKDGAKIVRMLVDWIAPHVTHNPNRWTEHKDDLSIQILDMIDDKFDFLDLFGVYHWGKQ